MIPNRIALITNGRHEEYPAGDGNTKPGMLVQLQSDGSVIPHAVAGEAVPIRVAKEDALLGGVKDTAYVTASIVSVQECAKGDVMLMRLASGQSVSTGDNLMSNGDGTLTASPGSALYRIVAPSTTITNTATETAFSNGSYAIPANYLKVGDAVRIRAKVFVIAENGTNTHAIKLYLGGTPITLVDSGALQLAANDFVEIDLTITVRTIGATGTIIGTGFITYTISATTTTKALTVASTTLDTTAAATVVIKSTASAASAGNQVRLDDFSVEDTRGTGLATLFEAKEAINNTGGTTPWIRATVL